jgi:hypothetical protein
MDRQNEPNDDGIESLGDATGMEAENDQSVMNPGHDVSDEKAEDEAGGDEKTAIEGAAGLAATHRSFGAMTADIQGGAGTHVPAEGDEHMTDAPDERKDSSDPRGY